MKKLFIIFFTFLAGIILTGCSHNKQSSENDDYKTALSQIEDGFYSDALVSLKKSINESPAHLESYLKISEVYKRYDQYTEAIEILNKGVNIVEDKDQIKLELGDLYLLNKQYDKAVNEFDSVLSNTNDSQVAAIGKAEALARKSDKEALLKFIESRKEIIDGDELQIIKALVLSANLKFNEAKAEANKLPSENSKKSELIGEIDKLIAKNNNIDSMMSITQKSINWGRGIFTKQLTEKVVSENVNYEGGYMYRGILNYIYGDLEKAKSDLERALQINSNLYDASQYLALTYYELKVYDKSQMYFDRTISLSGTNKNKTTELYVKYAKSMGLKEKYEELVNQLIAAGYEKQIYLIEIAEFYCINNNKEKLNLKLNDLKALNSPESEILDLINILEICANDPGSKVSDAQQILEKYPNNLFMNYFVYTITSDSSKLHYKERVEELDLDNYYTSLLDETKN